MAIDLAAAKAYFAKHHRGSVWASVDDTVQGPALDEAIRLIKRRLADKTAFSTATTTDDDDNPRFDCACFEQALYLLERGPLLRDGKGTLPLQLATDPETKGKGKPADMPIYSPEALRYLTSPTGTFTVLCMRG